jgi:hypothetical protein
MLTKSRIDVLVARTAPEIWPDIKIFGKSLQAHHFHIRDRSLNDWQAAYEAALKAFRSGDDPIPEVAKELRIPEGRARYMLSGYRSHPHDEIYTIAQMMVQAVKRNFRGVPQTVDTIQSGGRPVMGVHNDMIVSLYGEPVPIRRHFDALGHRRVNCAVSVPKLWEPLYERASDDDIALRVLDYLLTAASDRSATGRALLGDERKKRGRRKVIGRVPLTLETLIIVQKTLMESDQPIVDIYNLLVPITMSGNDFRKNLGNPGVQTGRVRASTTQKIVEWIEIKKHEMEQKVMEYTC